MTQEEKFLLFKDLSSRLPYKPQIKISIIGTKGYEVCELLPEIIASMFFNDVIEIKPYLRSMSNMTKEEREEIEILIFGEWFAQDSGKVDGEGWIEILANYDVSGIDPGFCSDYVDWLNAHHFDFRNLIEKGLSIEVTKENNPYK